MNFILFNGPPRSGKDTAARIAHEHVATHPFNTRFANWEKFSFPNKRAFAGQMRGFVDQWGHVNGFEERKDEVVPVLGASYRQWQIDYSEKFMKPCYGNDIFGRLLLDRCRQFDVELGGNEVVHIVSDCGFQVEVDVLHGHNVLLFQMVRDGCTYKGDSREAVAPAPDWTYYNVNNTGTVEETRQFLLAAIDRWLP